MSDVSLLSGIYANVEQYSSLIDRVLAKISNGHSDPHSEDQVQLGQLLIEAATLGKREDSVGGLFLYSLLGEQQGLPPVELETLGSSLLSGSFGPAVTRQLESISRRLEEERATVAHRIRGR